MMNGWSRRWAGVVGSVAVAASSACAMEEPIVRRDASSMVDARVADVPTGADVPSPPPDTRTGGCPVATETSCNGTCLDTRFNATHCGRCNNPCPSGQECVNSVCTSSGTCSAPRMMCGASCVDPTTDVNNCGTCGTRCAAGQSCAAGRCSTMMTGAPRTGLSCNAEADCGMNSLGRAVCNTGPSGWPGGYCQYLCERDADCGTGGRCALIEPVVVMGMTRNIGFCYTGCITPGERTGCRPGYVCRSAPEGGVCSPACDADIGACSPNACQATTGLCLRCNTSADCNGNGTCNTGTGECRCTAATNCGSNRQCISSTGRCGCMNNQGCPAGWTCTASTGQCAL